MSSWSEEPAGGNQEAYFSAPQTNADAPTEDLKGSTSASTMRARSRSPVARDERSGSPNAMRNRSPPARERFRDRSGGSYADRGDYARPRGRREPSSPAQPNNIIGVFGLSVRTSERALEDVYHEFGPIKRLELIRDRYSGDSRGFGFITFEEVAQATAARDKTNGMSLDGRQIRVDFSKTAGPRTNAPREEGSERPRGFPSSYPSRGSDHDRRRSDGEYRGRSSYGAPPPSRYRSRSPYERRSSRRSPSGSPPPAHRRSPPPTSRYPPPPRDMQEYSRRPY